MCGMKRARSVDPRYELMKGRICMFSLFKIIYSLVGTLGLEMIIDRKRFNILRSV